MDKRNVDVYACLSMDASIRTVELNRDLIEIIKNKSDSLYLKASNTEGETVLCSSSKTYQLRNKKHSNTVLLSKSQCRVFDSSQLKKLIGFSKLTSDFECVPKTNTIDVSNLPIYHDSLTFLSNSGKGQVPTNYISLDQLIDNTPLSINEFNLLWAELGGCEINGIACLLSNEVVHKTLTLLITSIIANDLEFNNLDLMHCVDSVGNATDYPINIVRSILMKFCTNDCINSQDDKFKLDETKIARWYGMKALELYAKKPILIDDFLIKWKSIFPKFYSVPISMKLLHGNFGRPYSNNFQNYNKIQFFPKNLLSNKIDERFRQLFKFQNQWAIEEFIPFVIDLNKNQKLKIDKFIMKYAKRKMINNNKEVVITSK
ncbi:Dcc1p ASCRUDRAFT_157787 [Ascoidea rubescens DSM 1968]|uniref:Sister chromatid cohesion protein DCC1 n=1 Tax=Ascoidea rubescens DSM 1968 TaxID=1344418 RepID=A0A1D2VR17_9ASCO|nr:hypothetical protein ASCRUDRAFT_157787 [Ascoidea rubescens DSM 1968]ODV64040.1 hypothetical protein ASCRUDRAFT_157787 [Ascoidea rubescens DSM 1968]